MGLRWSTPRVFGFSYSTRIGPRPNGRFATGLGAAILVTALLGVMLHFWYITIPLIVVLAGIVIYGKHVQRLETAPRTPPNRSQASISNRR